jgi:hypothetical protein
MNPEGNSSPLAQPPVLSHCNYKRNEGEENKEDFATKEKKGIEHHLKSNGIPQKYVFPATKTEKNGKKDVISNRDIKEVNLTPKNHYEDQSELSPRKEKSARNEIDRQTIPEVNFFKGKSPRNGPFNIIFQNGKKGEQGISKNLGNKNKEDLVFNSPGLSPDSAGMVGQSLNISQNMLNTLYINKKFPHSKEVFCLKGGVLNPEHVPKTAYEKLMTPGLFIKQKIEVFEILAGKKKKMERIMICIKKMFILFINLTTKKSFRM